MPSFYSDSAFLFRFVCLPAGILFVCYLVFSIVRHRFELSVDALCGRFSANLFLCLPDVLRTLVTLGSIGLWGFAFSRELWVVVPAQTAKLLPVFEKILSDTRSTSAKDRLYVPSQGARLAAVSDQEVALSVNYWMLGVRLYRIRLDELTEVRALLPQDLDDAQAMEQITSEPLLLTPVSQAYFTPQSLEIAQTRARGLSAQTMVDQTRAQLGPFQAFRGACRVLAWGFLPLLILGAALRFAQLRLIERTLSRDHVEYPVRLSRTLPRGLRRLSLWSLGAYPATARTGDGTALWIAVSPRLDRRSTIEGHVVTLFPLPPAPRWLQALCCVPGFGKAPFLALTAVVFLSLFFSVFLPEEVREALVRGRDRKRTDAAQ